MTTLVVTQLWGDAVLDVVRVSPRGSFDAAGRPLLENGLLRCDDEDARIEVDGVTISLRALVARGDAQVGVDGTWRYALPHGARAFVPRHGVMFGIEWMNAVAPVPAERLKHVDRAFAAVFASVLFFLFSASLAARVLGLLGFFAVTPGVDDLARGQLPILGVVLAIPTPEPPSPPRVAAAAVKPSGDPDAGEGAALSGDPGNAGNEKGTHRKTSGGRSASARPTDARESGVLHALSESGFELTAVFGQGVLADGMNQYLGILDGDRRADARGTHGQWIRGDGKGGGGKALQPGWGQRGRGPGRSGGGDKPGNLGPRGSGREARIDIGGEEVLVVGALDPAVIDGVIKRHLAQIQYCFQRELGTKPSLHGKLVVNFTIESDGRVSQARMKSSTMEDADVEQCVADRFRKIRFPDPKGGGTVSINYPLLFKSTGH